MRRPAALASTARLALRHRRSGARGLLWAVFHWVEAVRLADLLEQRGLGHLHGHFANAAAHVGLLATHLLGIGWSLTLHGSADFEGPERPLLGRKIAAARFVACVSDYGRAQALWAADPEDWPKVFVSRCGLVLPEAPAPREREPGAPLRVLSVGRLSPEKAQIGLVEALARLRERGIPAELCLLGKGTERARITERVRALGLSERVRLPGAATEEEVVAALGRADVFALSSLMEGLPVVLMEALALGIPVVAPRLAGIPELVEDGASGLLYAPADWEGLADGLTRLAKDAALGTRLAGEGRRRVERDHAIDRAVLPLLERLRDAG